MIFLSFLAASITGAAIYTALVSLDSRSVSLRVLLPVSMLMLILSLGLMYILPPESTQGMARAVLVLGLLWIGWVLLVSVVGTLAGRSVPDRRGTLLIVCGLGNFAPLLGYGLARMIA